MRARRPYQPAPDLHGHEKGKQMKKMTLRLLAGMLAMCGASAAVAQADPAVAGWAERLPSVVASNPPAQAPLLGARAEGKVLRISLGPIPANLATRPLQVAAYYAATICTAPGGPAFFADGRSIRVDVAGDGPYSGSAGMNRCPTPAETAITAENFAAFLQRRVGQRFADDLVLRAVRAEGNVLIATLDGPAGWRRGRSPVEISMVIAGAFCAPEAADVAFFSFGRAIRVDSLENGGSPQAGAVIERCPGR
jgi:hypothetical protein